jgi:EpsI family protein
MVPLPYVPVDVLLAEPGRTNLSNPYDQVVMRAYANPAGNVIALAVAYGAHQRQEVKIHQPELCYGGQGFRLVDRQDMAIRAEPAGVRVIPGRHLHAESPQGNEAVSYWIRIGDVLSQSAWDTRWHIFREGLSGRSTDGVLVRASSVVATSKEATVAFTQMDAFLSDLMSNASPELSRVLTR